MRQICLNLLSNALKFTPRGGRITLTRLPRRRTAARRCRVRDTGPGIPSEEIPKVLQAFGQGSLAHQTAEGGTGLGLPIVKSLIELHGGTFELRSELRKGTEVIVTLPAAAGDEADAAAAAARPGAPPPAGDRHARRPARYAARAAG